MKMSSKWQMNRAGVLNFWYYDDEVFDFSDGKLLLRGSNGSGKSVTMAKLYSGIIGWEEINLTALIHLVPDPDEWKIIY